MAETREENRRSGGRSDVEQPMRAEREAPKRQQQQGVLTRREPFGLWSGTRDPFALMNELFRSPFSALGRDFGDLERSIWSPSVEVYEKDGKLHVSADLPGLKKDDVRVNLTDNVLTIEGERQSERSDEKGGWSERSYGHFYRTIPLPEGINTENASATFSDGVLDIVMDAPKSQTRGRTIEITEGKR